jgi:hypothetical protein
LKLFERWANPPEHVEDNGDGEYVWHLDGTDVLLDREEAEDIALVLAKVKEVGDSDGFTDEEVGLNGMELSWCVTDFPSGSVWQFSLRIGPVCINWDCDRSFLDEQAGNFTDVLLETKTV